jgi:hypothetical protein
LLFLTCSYICRLEIRFFISYRNVKSDLSKDSTHEPNTHGTNYTKQGILRQEKMTEDEVFLNMLLATFSTKPIDSTTIGLGMQYLQIFGKIINKYKNISNPYFMCI